MEYEVVLGDVQADKNNQPVTLVYYKTVETKYGATVEVKDREETTTLTLLNDMKLSLDQQKASVEQQIADIQTKIEAVETALS
jgi:primosomal protein N''